MVGIITIQSGSWLMIGKVLYSDKLTSLLET